ncbi:MAG: toll/interleukin-1 receptor domain-containing protein [bacterium]|nr:toll/interleukin-1 receptor domain-containing protein [bacterium]
MGRTFHWFGIHKGVDSWNKWRTENPNERPNLYKGLFSISDLRNYDFSDTDLSKSEIVWSDLSGANLKGAKLRKTNLERSALVNSNLEGANLNGAILTNVALTRSNLNGADLREAELSNVEISRVTFVGANLADVDLSRTSIRIPERPSEPFFPFDGKRSYLQGKERTLQYSVNRMGTIHGIHVAIEGKASFKSACLQGAKLNCLFLRGVNFEDADLEGTNLRGADLREAVFKNANLKDADLRDTMLTGVIIDGANLTRIALSSDVDLCHDTIKWERVVEGSRTYTREDIETGRYYLTVNPVPKVEAMMDERSELENRINIMRGQLEELNKFLRDKRGKAKVFLSHTHYDKPIVEKVKRALESVGISTWYDNEQVRLGDLLSDTIQQGIDESLFVAVFISKRALESNWVRREIVAAQKDVERMKKKYIPIMLDDVEDGHLPLYLRDRVWADLKKRTDEEVEDVSKKIIETIVSFEREQEDAT